MQSSLLDEEYLMALEKRNHSDFRGLKRFDGLNSLNKKVPLIALRCDGAGSEKVSIYGYEHQRANLICNRKWIPSHYLGRKQRLVIWSAILYSKQGSN